MGNTVSAEASIKMPNISEGSNPPPECPMHKKNENVPEKPKVSECPVQAGQQGTDINPYNMVSLLL